MSFLFWENWRYFKKTFRNYLTFTYSSTIILLVFYIFIHNTIHTTYKHEYLDFSHISIIYTMYALISNFCLYICKLSLKTYQELYFCNIYFSFFKPILWVKRTLCTIHYSLSSVELIALRLYISWIFIYILFDCLLSL